MTKLDDPGHPLDPATLHRELAPWVRRLAARVARPRGRMADLEDLVSSGFVALFEAALRYRVDRGAAFSTFALPRVRGAVLDALFGLDPTPRSVRPRRHRSVRSAPRSLDAAPQLNSVPLVDELPDPTADDDASASPRDLERLASALATLTERERRLLQAHYRDDRSLSAAGAALGLSRSGACRLHARAIDKLSRLLEDPDHAESPRHLGAEAAS